MFYADTSALVKLTVVEAESDAMRTWMLAGAVSLATSDLARTELLRAVRRSAPDAAGAARDLLSRLFLLAASAEIFEAAARLDPVELRSLDAVHLASALALGDDLEGVVTYDDRLGDAARALGIPVLPPADPRRFPAVAAARGAARCRTRRASRPSGTTGGTDPPPPGRA
jgi:predicted nucleic acid-binding protein